MEKSWINYFMGLKFEKHILNEGVTHIDSSLEVYTPLHLGIVMYYWRLP